MIPNPALDRMRAGGVALGMVVRLGRSGDIARIARLSDHDFIFIDMQHGAFSVETAAEIAQAARGCGVTPLARVRAADDPNIGVLLDCGLMGIVVPDVATPEAARNAVNASKFAPIGKRSLSTPHTSLEFRSMPHAESMESLNEATLLACMIETVEGVESASDIAAIEGIDVLHVGCTDLLVDMGGPGDLEHPGLTQALERVIIAARSSGKFAGVGGVREIDQLRELIGRGVQFLTAHSDVGLLISEAARRTEALRATPPASGRP